MTGVELTLTDDILLGLVLVLLKTLIKPSKIEGQIVLALIPLLFRIVKKSHKEHSALLKPIEHQLKVLSIKLKGGKLTLG